MLRSCPAFPSVGRYCLYWTIQLIISSAIKYPEHDLHSRRVIWRKFFELAGVKTKDADGSGRSTPTDMVLLEDPAKVATMSEAELDELAEKPFNGRTIKNLVRTAQALALASCVPHPIFARKSTYDWTGTSQCQRLTSILWSGRRRNSCANSQMFQAWNERTPAVLLYLY
jgi:hypothetical protein